MSTRRRVVVVGSGISGLTAAIHAQERGAEVIVVEVADAVGGSSGMAYGALRTFRDEGVFRFLNPSGESGPARAIETSFDPAVALLASLEIPLEVDVCILRGEVRPGGCCQPGSIYSRHYRIVDTKAAVNELARALVARGGTVLTGTRMDRLVIVDRAVTGVVAQGPGGSSGIDADAVVLATGGYQGNLELLARYVGPFAGLMTLRSNPNSVGDGLLAGLAADGAVTRGLHAFYGHLLPAPPAVITPANFVSTTGYYTPLSIVLNLAGRRFSDESLGDDETARAAVRQDKAAAFAIFDAETDRTRVGLDPSRSDRIAASAEAGARLARLDTLDAVADCLGDWGVSAAAAARTLRGYGRAMDTGDDRELDVPRSADRRAISEPPFTVIALRPSITFTFGGLRVDERCRVLDRRGTPIPGLYAAGVDIGGIYVEQYGGGLGAALALGYAAGDGATG